MAWIEADLLSLARGESDRFERKGSKLLLDEAAAKRTLAKTVSAFANSTGGTIFLGLHDDSSVDVW